MPFNQIKAREIHKNKYDYTRVIYKNIDTKVEISCPDHGIFLQTPYKHINSGQGCPSCKGVLLANQRRMSKEEFVEKANKIHKNKYDYTNTKIINSHKKIEIICQLHGTFLQTPNNHLHSSNGCPSCGYNISDIGREWLDSFNNNNIIREHTILIGNRKFKVDGFDPLTNTIYEYFGKFWHGCPSTTDHTKINPKNKIPYKILYEKTLERIDIFENSGFNLISIWG